MNATVTVVLLGILMIGYLAKKKYAGIIFNAMWFFSFLIIACYRNDFHDNTVNLLFLTVLCTNLAYLLSCVVRHKDLSAGDYERNRLLYMLLLCGTAAILVVYAIRTVALFGFDLSRIRAGNNSDSEDRVFKSAIDTVLFYGFASGMAHIGPMVLVYEFLRKKPIGKAEILLNIFNTVCFLLTDAGRMLLVRFLLFGVAALIWMMADRTERKRVLNWRTPVILVVVFVALGVMTFSRNASSVGFFEQAVSYIGGSLGHMDVRLQALESGVGPGQPPHDINFGTITYGGFLYYPIKAMNTLFGTKFQNSLDAVSFLQEYTQFYLGSEKYHYNAIVPNAFYYYFDSGLVGVCLFSFIFGYLLGKYEKFRDRPSFFSYVMFSMCVYAAVFSPLGGIMWNFRMPTTIIIAYILSKLVYYRSGGTALAGNTDPQS